MFRPTGESSTGRLARAGDELVVELPDRYRVPDLPLGWTALTADGVSYEGNFTDVGLDALRRVGAEGNELPALLTRWFGPDAGAPDVAHEVMFERGDTGWQLAPAGPGPGSSRPRERWRHYLRPEIPALFGLNFSEAVWNAGYVRREGHIFLLVTLEKKDLSEGFQYEDRFLAPDLFQWQSQNRTKQDSADGRALSRHQEQAREREKAREQASVLHRGFEIEEVQLQG